MTKNWRTDLTIGFVAPLAAHFIPQVEKVIEPALEKINAHRPASERVTAEYNITHELPLAGRGDVIRHLTIKFTGGPLFLDQLANLGAELDPFCVNEDKPTPIHGKFWTLGDGDDGMAVFLQNGVINIWLRGWAEDWSAE